MARLSYAAAIGLLLCVSASAHAQERPYFVTYSDYLEEKGDLEVSVLSTIGAVKDNPNYFAPWIEIEYGVMKRWTAELYIEGVTVHQDASAFTGWRVENRFRPFAGEHFLNPVLYVEYESINAASRIQKEIVGEGTIPDESVRTLKHDHAHELEGRLILSKKWDGWEVAGNGILEKNLSEDEGVEFGYATGFTKRFRKLYVGAEAYGGLGASLAQHEETRHFIAPLVGWKVSKGLLKAEVGFGLTEASERYLVRVGYSIDVW